MSQSAAISPGWFVPISRTRKSASSGVFRIVRGRPMWLLKFPPVAWVFPARERNALRNSFVVVLPAEPVTPTTFALRDDLYSEARRCSSSRPSTTPAAPFSSACGMKSRPSTFSPLSATKSIPGLTRRESDVAPANESGSLSIRLSWNCDRRRQAPLSRGTARCRSRPCRGPACG